MTSRRSVRRRVAAGLAALVAATALAIVDPLGPTQRADAAIDPITGFGTTDSAVTLKWADGVVRSDNKTIAAPREKSGHDAFYEDLQAKYKDLTVTVGQTEDLTHQGVHITWTGGAPTDTSPNRLIGDYLQIMQCYGDAPTGPDPEACQWGGFGPKNLPAGPRGAVQQDKRGGDRCPPNGIGCDPAEPSEPDHQLPTPGRERQYYVPFTPVGKPDLKIYNDNVNPADQAEESLRTYYQAQSTNEVPVAATSADGTGQVSFEVQTGREASGLGCGERNTAAGGAPRGCWLVIVPRGVLAPDGSSQSGVSAVGVRESALSASNWALRMQVHLSFLPTSLLCPQGTDQRPTVGTELVGALMTSWQPALCQNGGAVYDFTATPDATNAIQLASNLPGAAGLAFTTQPIAFADQGPPLIYAPVAVTGITFAFRIDVREGAQTRQIQQLGISPQLLAKALTQSYKADLPGGVTSSSKFVKPTWLKTVYGDGNVTFDPLWQQLNPGVVRPANFTNTTAPMTTADQSAVNQAVWSWIQSEPTARAWLGGQPDAGGMVVNPNYQSLNLDDSPPAANYPRADPMCTRWSGTPASLPDVCLTSVDYIPYALNLEDAAVHVQRAYTHGAGGWDVNAQAPDGSQGWWEKSGPWPLGNRFAWAITSASLSARYGLPTAGLCLSEGGGCAAPSAASLTAAMAAAKSDSTGLLRVDPADPGPGGYPLTQIVYAAVRTDKDPATLRDAAALLDHAAGAGQTSGVEIGQLPPGYLPLSESLRAKTRAAAETLREIAATAPSPTPSPTSAGGGDSDDSDSDEGAGVPNGGASPATASPSSVPPGGTVSQPPQALAAGSTPNDALGAIRWVLVAALISAAGVSLGGIVLRHPPPFLIRPSRRTRVSRGGQA